MEMDIVTCAHCGAPVKPSSLGRGLDNQCKSCGNFFNPDFVNRIINAGRPANDDDPLFLRSDSKWVTESGTVKETRPRARSPATRIPVHNKTKNAWIDVEEVDPGHFVVVDDNLTVKGGDPYGDMVLLGISSWDGDVDDLDNGQSDESQCFGMSNHLRWMDVDMAPYEFSAPSIDRLKEALDRVSVVAWCPGDI